MQQILLAVQVLVAIGLIAMVLLQQGRGADAGASFGGGASGSLFGSRGPATFLAKITAVLALVFFVNSLALAYLAAETGRARSVVERFEKAPDTDVPAVPGAGAPADAGGGDVPSVPAGASDGAQTPPQGAQN